MINSFQPMTPEQAYWESKYQSQYDQYFEIDTELWPLQQIEHMLNTAVIGEAEASGLSAEFYKRAYKRAIDTRRGEEQ
jgi:hypothetical protein